MGRSYRLAPPELRHDLLVRPRLLAMVLERWEHRVTLLIGGPGFGKTTLLAQAIDDNRRRPRGEDIWVALEPQDAAADDLARSVSAAVGVPGTGDLANAGSEVVDPALVADAVWRRAPTEVCLIVDDAHLLPSGSSGAAWLTALLDALPANGHVLLASRAEPAIPLARLGAQGAVRRVGQDDLRFSPTELAQLAAQRGIEPDRLAGTAGWPALAELAASVERPGVANAYLWQQVLEPLGGPRRQVLATVCDLGGADDELASAALGTSVDLAATLDGIPLVSQDTSGWYTPHTLWSDAPRLDLTPSQRERVRRRAIANLRDRAWFDEAFALMEESQLWDEAPALLRAACLATRRLTAVQLDRWLSACPASVRSSSIGSLAAALRTTFTEPAAAIEPLRDAARRLREDGDLDAELTAIAVLGRMAWTRQDPGPMGAELATRVGELEATGHRQARALAALVRAMVADIAADDAAVLAALDAIEPRTLDPFWEALATWMTGLVRLDLGDADAAAAVLARVERSPDPAVRAILGGLDVRILWARGQIDAGVRAVPLILDDVRAAGAAMLVHYAMTNGAMIFAHVGQLDAARRCLQEAASTAASVAPTATARTLLATAAVELGTGDETRATATILRALAASDGAIDRGIERRMWRHQLPLTYVLVPETRARWDALPLRGYLVTVRELARAVVAVRSGHAEAALQELDLSDLERVRAGLHHRFAAELAVGLAATGRPEGPALLDALGPAGREAVRSVAAAAVPASKPARSLLAAVPAPPAHPVELAVLGPMTLRRGGTPDGGDASAELRRKRLRELLAFLIIHRTTDRAAIQAALWPDLNGRAGGNNLAVTLTYALHALEPSRTAGEPAYLIRQDGQSIWLVTGPYLRIDTDRFDHHLAEAAHAEADGVPSVALEHTLGAVGLYRGDLFADVPQADWMLLEREHFRTRYVGAATRAGQLLLARGDGEQAEAVAHGALAADPLAEDAYGVLVAAALARGEHGQARDLLDRCMAALAELGVEPSETTRRLRRRLEDDGIAARHP